MAAAQGGLPALGPALQGAFELTLVQVTGIFTAFGAGTVLTVYAWGALVDRIGERVVLASGPALGGVALALATLARRLRRAARRRPRGRRVRRGGHRAAAGAPCSAGFPRAERGFALGLRQTAVPVGAAAASFSLPPLAAATSVDLALLVLAGGLVLSSVVAGIWLRDPPARRSAAPPAPPAARDPRIWRLGAASALLIVGQVGVTSLLVLYLFSERGWSAAGAAVALGNDPARRRGRAGARRPLVRPP